GDVNNIAALSRDEVLCGPAGHEHRARDVRRKHGFEAFTVKVNEVLEDPHPGIVHKNVEVAELLDDLAIRPLDIRLNRYIGVNWVDTQVPRRIVQSALVTPGDRNARPCSGKTLRYRAPNAAAPTRDQRDRILQ